MRDAADDIYKDIQKRMNDIAINVYNIKNKLKKEKLTEEEVDIIYSYLDKRVDKLQANKRGTKLERKWVWKMENYHL